MIAEMIEAVGDFMELGGDVLWAIFTVALVMWVFIIEREWYFHFVYKNDLAQVLEKWEARGDRVSWYAKQIRRRMISELSEKLHHSLSLIKTLVALCPLLGLLGTVTGMIRVFDVMAIAGNSNPRAMASGVSMATIPTMAGMVAALSGLYFIHQLEQFANNETQKAADSLVHD